MHVTVKHVAFQDAQGIDWAVDEMGNLLSKAIDPATGAGNWVLEKERYPGLHPFRMLVTRLHTQFCTDDTSDLLIRTASPCSPQRHAVGGM